MDYHAVLFGLNTLHIFLQIFIEIGRTDAVPISFLLFFAVFLLFRVAVALKQLFRCVLRMINFFVGLILLQKIARQILVLLLRRLRLLILSDNLLGLQILLGVRLNLVYFIICRRKGLILLLLRKSRVLEIRYINWRGITINIGCNGVWILGKSMRVLVESVYILNIFRLPQRIYLYYSEKCINKIIHVSIGFINYNV